MNSRGDEPLDVFIVAGESSGDQLGAALMREISGARPNARFRGVGGPAMTGQGLASLFPMSDIAVMGFVPVLKRLPTVLARIRATAEAVLARPPDVLAIIDSPDFTHRVARRARAKNPAIPIVDYVSPTVWAWRPGRARKMRAYVDTLLAVLPFEPETHRKLGGPPCVYVGHPLMERLGELRPQTADEFSARDNAAAPTILVMPGSRRSEIGRMLAAFGGAVALVAREYPKAEFVLPTVPHLEAEARAGVASWPVAARVVVGDAEKFAAFRRARAALAKSGTLTLELALAGVPAVVGYKVPKLEEWIVKSLTDLREFVLPNLILGEKAVPGFLQEACNPQQLSRTLLPLLRDGPERAAQLAALARLDAIMRLPDGETPASRAAAIVIAQAERGRARQ